MNNTQVVCFGEILWDVFPDKRVIGGAPLNVALRLNTFQVPVAIVSCIGADALGESVISYLQEHDLSYNYIQKNPDLSTGKVQVTLDDTGSASYVIEKPVAWDLIKLSPELISLVKESPFFLFGSLAARGAVNRHTLQKLLQVAKTKIFDVNLRKPDYDISMIYELMQMADVVKMNEEELDEICVQLGCQELDLEERMVWLDKTTNTHTICVTKAGKGASLLLGGNFYNHRGYKVEVKDTVGAGDSFLATLITHLLLRKEDPLVSLGSACAVGAMVASKEGANCKILEVEIESLMSLGN